MKVIVNIPEEEPIADFLSDLLYYTPESKAIDRAVRKLFTALAMFESITGFRLEVSLSTAKVDKE